MPAEVCAAYGVDSLEYGIDYILPKPLAPRILTWVTPAVAKAAMETGVARKPSADLDAYAESLKKRVADSQARIKAFTQDYFK